MISGRSEVIRMICAAKAARNITWAEAAQAISQSKEWTAAACPGQMAFTKEQAGESSAPFPDCRKRPSPGCKSRPARDRSPWTRQRNR